VRELVRKATLYPDGRAEIELYYLNLFKKLIPDVSAIREVDLTRDADSARSVHKV